MTFAKFSENLLQIKVLPKLFSKESRSRRLLETSNKTYAKPASPVHLDGTSGAHSALVSCQSDRRCRENESSRCTERNASHRRCIDTRTGNRFWTSSGIKPRGIFIHTFEIAAGKDRSLDTPVIDNRQKNWKADSLSADSWDRSLPMSGFIWTESADGFK